MASSPAPAHEDSSIALAGVVGLALLLFALVFLVVYPTQEKPSFSEMVWAAPPALMPSDENGLVLVASVRVDSFEREVTTYHAVLRIEGSIAAVRDFSLTPGAKSTITFRVPITGNVQPMNEVRVTLSRDGVDDANKSRRELELVDYFTDANVAPGA